MALPIVKTRQIWLDAAASATVVLEQGTPPEDWTLFKFCTSKIVEVVTTGFTGTLDIRGRADVSLALLNIAYARIGQATQAAVSISQLSWTADTGHYFYLILTPLPENQLVMTRSAGTISVIVHGLEESIGLQPIIPLPISDNSGALSIDVGGVAPALYDTNKIAAVMYVGSPGGASSPVYQDLSTADGFAKENNVVALWAASLGRLYNDSTWDRARNNVACTIYASAARTAAPTLVDMVNYNARGLIICINCTAIVATPSVVFVVEGKDSIPGDYWTMLSSVPIVATGKTVLMLGPTLTEAANLKANCLIPRTYRVRPVHGDADSITYSVSVDEVL